MFRYVLALACLAGLPAGRLAASKDDEFRLPADLVPLSYDLRVATDFDRLTYSGRVQIVVRAAKAACRVVLNAQHVRVTDVRVADAKSGEPVTVISSHAVDHDERLVVAVSHRDRCLTPGRSYAVTVEFAAPLRDDMSGFYKSSYKENNVTKWLAVTKFEPTHARKAFPCFDEPALKAPFRVSIGRRSDQISLSNMPLLNTTKDNSTDIYWDHFQETPPMSTYLVAFFVGEFYAIKTRYVGVYTHKDYVSQAEYIASKAPKLLEAMENYTGIEYMIPKLDLLAIPDFMAGAMENWGLNTYRERLLLLTEDAKTKTKEYVVTVVQHELSHQWFGDSVTCAWWDYLWLNEGFATFFEYFASKMVEPDWRLEDVFVYEILQTALEADQSPMHAISSSVKTPSEIKGMFDEISYDKAGSVLRMLQYTVTESNFKKALNYYLKDNKNKAATPEELWTAFENVLFENNFELNESISVTQFMKSWTEQPGYPLVEIAKVNNTFVITQERFLVENSNSNDTTQWIIGLTYTTEDKKDFNKVIPTVWLTEKQTTLSNQLETGWYIFNLQSIGFYRVNYEPDNWNALIDQLNKDATAIHVLNRAQLIDDAFNLAKANRMKYGLTLRLTKYLEKENDMIPWYSAKEGFTFLLARMRRYPKGYNNIKAYVSYLAGIIHLKTKDLVEKHNSTNHTIKSGWNSFSNWACSLDNGDCTRSALNYFEKWLNGEKIPADIKDAAFCAGVRYGDSGTWNRILNVYINSESASERQSAQSALACSNSIIQLSKYLDFMFEGSGGPIRPQDFRVIYQTLALSSNGLSVMAEFLTNKLDRILKEIFNGEQVATSIYSILASKMVSDDEIFKIDNLRKNPSVPLYLQKKFNSSYESVGENLAWFKMNHIEINDWVTNALSDLQIEDPKSKISTTPIFEYTDSTPNPTPQPSSAIKNAQAYVFILQITSLTLLINLVNYSF